MKFLNKNFYRFFYIFFTLLFIFYGIIGIIYYNKSIPFFDSFSFQLKYADILKDYETKGYFSSLNYILKTSNTYYFVLISSLLTPILPKNPVVGLYIIFYITYFFLFIFITFSLTKIIRDKLKVLLSIFIFLSCNFFSWTWGGIIDQRLDFLGGVLLVSAFLSFNLLLYEYKNINLFFYFIFSLILALHRPIFIIYLFLFYLFFYLKKENRNKLLNKKFIFINSILFLVLLLIFNKNIFDIFRYYTIYNIDVGKNQNYFSSIVFILENIVKQIGIFNLLVIFFLLFLNKTNFKLNTKNFFNFLIFFLIIFSPFILSKSGTNPLVILSVNFILIFGFFVIILKEIKLSKQKLFNFLILFLLVINFLFNTFKLARSVLALSNNDRKKLEKVVNKLYLLSDKDRRFISGIYPLGSYIYGLDYLYLKNKFIRGVYFNHATDFGIDKKNQFLFLDDDIKKSLQRSCQYPGFFIVLNDKNKNDPNAYLYVERFVKQIYKKVEKLPCLEKKLFDFEYDNKYYSVFLIK
jgi:hypothetical protein